MTKNMIKTIQNTAFQNELWARGARIVLGVSGGADSACLLDVMAKIAPKADLKLLIAHINYGLRGKDSERDEAFVRKLAEKYELKISVLSKIEVSDFLKSEFRKMPSENELREIRYAFFEEIRQANDFDSIAVAHNANDQVETFLMRIIRGAGLKGLSAMKYKNNFIIRPLLGISRKEILSYLKKNKLSFRTDKTNAQDLFFRNKVRNKLLPYLEKNFNPQIGKTISNSVAAIADDYDFLEKVVAKEARSTKELSVQKILALHPALQKRLLLKFMEEKKADLKNIEASHIEETLKILKSTKGKNQVVLYKGLKITRKGDRVTILKN